MADPPARDGGESLYKLARDRAEAGQPDAALNLLDQARAAFQDEGAPLLSMRTDLGRINVLDDLGRTTESIVVAQQLQRDLRAIDTVALDSAETALYLWLSAAAAENLGATLGLVGRHKAAVEAHKHARKLYRTAGSDIDVARASANLGVDLIHTGDPRAALEVLENARHQFLAGGDPALAHRCLLYQARALAIMGDYGQALDRLAAVQAPAVDEVDSSAGIDTLRGELARAGVYEALNLFPETLQLCSRLAEVFDQRKLTRDLATCRHIEARTMLGMGRWNDAQLLARECVDLFESVRLPVRAASARVTLALGTRAPRGCADVDLALEQLRGSGESRSIAEAALAGAELTMSAAARTNYLDEAVDAGALESPETRWRALWNRSKNPQDAASRVALLDSALSALDEIHGTLDADHLRAPFMANRREPLEARLAAHLRAAESAAAYRLSATYRAMALRGSVEPLPLPPPTETTLLYQSIGDRLVCFIRRPATTAEEVEAVDLGEVGSEVRDLLVRLAAEWRHFSNPAMRAHLDALRAATERVLRRLYAAVFEPLADRLEPGPLTILPTGYLAGVPFAALFDGSSYLIDSRALSISPGVTSADSSTTARSSRTLVVGLADELAPSITTEVEQIAQVANGLLLRDDNAHTAAVLAALGDVDIIHLATHSVFRSDNPWLSSLRLADREVTARELATWDLNGRTLVLAACSSGQQLSLGEDELVGLPRAALLAGANCVVVNQWLVDDAASVDMMANFHSWLPQLGTAEALRRSQLHCRAEHPHPYFWAAPMMYIGS